MGTNGRVNRKELLDAATCEAEVAKLIQEKLKKGYCEIGSDEPVPAKQTAVYRPMDEDLFWELIAAFNWKRTGDDEAVMRPVEKRLAAMPVEDIFAFEEILAEKLYQLDGEKYAAACYHGETRNISGDLFLYDRCGVVVNGRELYEQVVQHPELWPVGGEFESLLFLPQQAYKRKTRGGEYPYVTKVSYETCSNAAAWPNG
ncbi:DUF4240 domain-containing protein [Hymenobacter busanensis]|uniref:DUF4240 domain-containing protein n=1 Tax=Hymenobacter busanensis TaxID=2607656 RepID=A0A7L4ZWZ0_9BACT|nr:DUF4240 domain-containing protein [Hymenobacter busanensis]QHJ08014.1 DUF4240 domain-containing protein [Hymenobacter busanensis]